MESNNQTPHALRISICSSISDLFRVSREGGLDGRDRIGYAAKTLNTASVNCVNSVVEIVKAGMI